MKRDEKNIKMIGKNSFIIQCFAAYHTLFLCTLHSNYNKSDCWSNFKVNRTHEIMWSFWSSQKTVEIWRDNGWIELTRIQRLDPLTCFTNHCHMVRSCPLNYERMRFGQNWQRSNALVFIVSSFYHLISA